MRYYNHNCNTFSLAVLTEVRHPILYSFQNLESNTTTTPLQHHHNTITTSFNMPRRPSHLATTYEQDPRTHVTTKEENGISIDVCRHCSKPVKLCTGTRFVYYKHVTNEMVIAGRSFDSYAAALTYIRRVLNAHNQGEVQAIMTELDGPGVYENRSKGGIGIVLKNGRQVPWTYILKQRKDDFKTQKWVF
jgi:hypothetical protein